MAELLARPHRKHAEHELRLIATDVHVAWSVYMCVGHTHVPCKNCSTDRDAVWN